MRWYWIDRFEEFVSGQRAVALKCLSIVEEHVDRYVPARPSMSGALILEGFAQTGGLLVGEHNGFQKRVVLAKVSKAEFHTYPRPGDVMRYTCTLEQYDDSGAQVLATSHINGELQCAAEMMFGHVPPAPGIPDEMFEPADFLTMIRTFRMYEVLRDSEGNLKPPPPHLLAAEKLAAEPYIM